MKIWLGIFTFGIILVLLLGSVNVHAKTTHLDPTSTEDGKDSKVFKIGEVKYNYEVHFYVKNEHDICNISVLPGDYYNFPMPGVTLLSSYEWNITSGKDLDWYSGYSFKLNPNDEGSFSIKKVRAGESTNLGLKITAIFNTSAFNDQQTDVEVTYTMKVYDDRGNLIIDTEDPEKSGDAGEEVDDGACGGAMFLSGLCIVLILGSMIIIKRLKK